MSFIKIISVFCITAITGFLNAAEPPSLSTSNLKAIKYMKNGEVIMPCAGTKASYGGTYVSIDVKKVTVNSRSSAIRRFFNSRRKVFPIVSLVGTFSQTPLNVSKVGHEVLLERGRSSVDLGVEWSVISKLPWLLRNAQIDLRVGYSADSRVEGAVEALNKVTSSIPDYTMATSGKIGLGVMSSVDNLIFGEGRARNLLRLQKDMPLFDGNLCEGVYIALSAADATNYNSLLSSNSLIWDGNQLLNGSDPIQDLTYIVLDVNVTESFYQSAQKAINDNGKNWALKFQNAMNEILLLAIGDRDQINDIKEQEVRTILDEARVLLEADNGLINTEKQIILRKAYGDLNNVLSVAKNRVDDSGQITNESTLLAFNQHLSSQIVRDWDLEEKIISLSNENFDPSRGFLNFEELPDTEQLQLAIGNIERELTNL